MHIRNTGIRLQYKSAIYNTNKKLFVVRLKIICFRLDLSNIAKGTENVLKNQIGLRFAKFKVDFVFSCYPLAVES